MSRINDIQTNLWEKQIKKLAKNSDAKGLERYKEVIKATAGIDELVKAVYIEKCDETIKSICAELSDEVESKVVGAKNVSVKVAAAGIATFVVVSVAAISLVGCGGDEIENNEASLESTEGQLDNEDTIKPTLAFNPEDTDVMTTNISTFLNNSLYKGLMLSEETLANDLEAFVDFYVALNIDEIGPGYLAELYQDDKKSYLDIFNNFVRYAMDITDEAMMSDKDNVFDISSITSNKVEGEMLQRAFNLLAGLHDNGLAGNKEALEENAEELNEILNEVLLDEKSASYSTASKIMLAYIAMNADTLLQNYSDIVVVDDDTRKIMFEDAEIGCAMTLRDYKKDGKDLSDADLILLLNASEKNQSAVEFAAQIEKKIDQMVLILNTTDKDYSDKRSVAEVIEILMQTIDLSLYRENQEYTEYNDATYEMNYPTKKIPEGAIRVGNGYVTKEQMAQYGATTIEEYEQAIEETTDKTFDKEDVAQITGDENTTEDDKVVTGENADVYAADFSRGYNAGTSQGAMDGNALVIPNPNTTGSQGYIDGYAAGYNAEYEKAKQKKLSSSEPVKVEIETLKTPVQESTEVIESGNINVVPNNPSTGGNTTITDVEDQIIEEEVIEEGILQPDQYTLSADELYSIYESVLYPQAEVSTDEAAVQYTLHR